MLRRILYVLLFPALFIFRLIILLGVALNALSTGVLSVAASAFGLLALLLFCSGNHQSGWMLLALVWMFSPIGLPFLTERLLFWVDGLCGDLLEWLQK